MRIGIACMVELRRRREWGWHGVLSHTREWHANHGICQGSPWASGAARMGGTCTQLVCDGGLPGLA